MVSQEKVEVPQFYKFNIGIHPPRSVPVRYEKLGTSESRFSRPRKAWIPLLGRWLYLHRGVKVDAPTEGTITASVNLCLKPAGRDEMAMLTFQGGHFSNGADSYYIRMSSIINLYLNNGVLK